MSKRKFEEKNDKGRKVKLIRHNATAKKKSIHDSKNMFGVIAIKCKDGNLVYVSKYVLLSKSKFAVKLNSESEFSSLAEPDYSREEILDWILWWHSELEVSFTPKFAASSLALLEKYMMYADIKKFNYYLPSCEKLPEDALNVIWKFPSMKLLKLYTINHIKSKFNPCEIAKLAPEIVQSVLESLI